MLGFLRPVVEVDFSVDDLNIVECEARRRPGWTGGKFIDEILKVVFEVIIADQIDIGFYQLQFLDHRGQAEERLHLQIDEKLSEGNRGDLTLPLLHQKAADRQGHRIRIDPDLFDGNLAMEFVG